MCWRFNKLKAAGAKSGKRKQHNFTISTFFLAAHPRLDDPDVISTEDAFPILHVETE